jgi:hypothetical protein
MPEQVPSRFGVVAWGKGLAIEDYLNNIRRDRRCLICNAYVGTSKEIVESRRSLGYHPSGVLKEWAGILVTKCANDACDGYVCVYVTDEFLYMCREVGDTRFFSDGPLSAVSPKETTASV